MSEEKSCCCCGEQEKEHNHGASCCCGEHEHEHGGCACGGDCHHEEERKIDKILLAVSVGLMLLSFIPMNTVPGTIIMIAAVLLSAYPILFGVLKNIKKFSLGETELMLIAVVAACCLQEFREAAAVAILYRLGEILEEKAVEKSRKSIDAVSKIQQDFAHLIKPDGTTEKVQAEDVSVGSLIKVLPYERFPIDGIVTDGYSTADASAITGESLPVDLVPDAAVKSGMINGESSVTVKTTHEFSESTASRIVKMVEEAAEKKGKTQKMITRLAKVYTPIVVVGAVLIAVIGSIATKNPSEWIYRALTFLVASCPCALVISVPLGFYTGLGAAAKKGILVKGTAFVEAVAKARAVIFDKTGTLTTGEFEIETINPLNGFSENELLVLAGAAEKFSSHPIAKSIVAFAPKIDERFVSDFKEKAGNGSSVVFAGKKVLCGSKRFLEREGIDVSELHENEICVSADGVVAGSILLRSRLRDGAVEMIDSLKTHGIEHAVMLTGDNEIAAKTVADECEIDEYHCNLLPEDKLKHLERIKHLYSKVIYVGDGINDAPVLAAADAGVAMGMGTQAANEAGDIIITNNDLRRFALAHKLFKRTHATVWFNILFAIGVKAIVLLLGAFGIAPIWLAVFADVGVCLICVAISSMIGLEKK